MEYVPVEIASLSLVPSGGGTCAIVLRQKEGSRILPVVIGLLEAQSIAVKIQGMPMPRPLTHDVMLGMMEQMKAKLSRVNIDNVREGTFYATMEIEFDGGKLQIDSRPSDAIALAVRCEAPIYVALSVMNKAGATPEGALKIGEDSGNNDSRDQDESDANKPEDFSDSTDPIHMLEKSMQNAIAKEDYELAAKIRDEIRRIKDSGEEKEENED